MPQQRASKKQAFGYVRVSIKAGVQSQTSIEDQEAAIRNDCRAKSIDVARVFIDAGVSGSRATRPALAQLMAAVEAGSISIDYVVVHSLSRFIRDPFELESHLGRFRCAGVSLVSISDDEALSATPRFAAR